MGFCPAPTNLARPNRDFDERDSCGCVDHENSTRAPGFSPSRELLAKDSRQVELQLKGTLEHHFTHIRTVF